MPISAWPEMPVLKITKISRVRYEAKPGRGVVTPESPDRWILSSRPRLHARDAIHSSFYHFPKEKLASLPPCSDSSGGHFLALQGSCRKA